jgi:TonB family protein
MIAVWMLSALLFTALVAGAAWCAEAALRVARKPTRWPWIVALAAAVTWPVIAPLARRLIPAPAPTGDATILPSISISSGLPAATSWMPRLDAVLLTLWVVASLVVIVRLVRGFAALSRIRRASTPRVVDGLNVLVSENIGPAVVGVMTPSVLLPASLLDLDAPLRRLVLRHEDEHRRARDPWIVFGSAIAVALVPWNLPLWWISRRARLALEVDCDARVLATDANATQYGKLLLLIAQRQTVTALAPMLAARNAHLERRIDAMLSTQQNRRRTKFAAAVLGTVVVGIAACTSRIGDIAAPTPAAVARRPLVLSQGEPYAAYQVEKEARQIPGSGNLRYPDMLRSAQVEGQVVAQFVVDANGAYEPGSFNVLKSDHELFTKAIATALPSMRFAPALVGGRGVRQLVQQPFVFSLSKLADENTVAVAPAAKITASGSSAPARLQLSPSLPPATKSSAPAAGGADKPYFEFRISKKAAPIPGAGSPRYPDALRAANVEGEVLAQFVVDEDGTIVAGSLKVLRSNHELFTEAVKAALPEMRFSPAEVDGRKVKQLLQQSFTFGLGKGQNE